MRWKISDLTWNKQKKNKINTEQLWILLKQIEMNITRVSYQCAIYTKNHDKNSTIIESNTISKHQKYKKYTKQIYL